MNEEQMDVNEGAQSSAESSAAEQEQVSIDSEVVNTQETDGKDYKSLYENAKIALRKEREAKKAVTTAPVVTQPEISEDETVRRFIQTEANATIALKLQTDPSFKDRVEIVQDYVKQGHTIEMADKLAKADIMDRILASGVTETATNKPKQIQPTAIPEPTEKQSTGNILDDIEKGLVDADPELVATLKKFRSKG